MTRPLRPPPGRSPRPTGTIGRAHVSTSPAYSLRRAAPRRPWQAIISPSLGAPCVDSCGLLETGTIIAEVAVPPDLSERLVLMCHRAADDWVHGIAVLVDPSGRVRLVHRQGARRMSAEVRLPDVDYLRSAAIRFCWNAPRRDWALTVEDLVRGRTQAVTGADPLPVPEADALAMLAAAAPGAGGPLIWAAVTAEILATATEPMLHGAALVLTGRGLRRAADIRAGERLVTRDGGLQPVIWAGGTACAFRDLGSFAPVVLRANYLGAEEDLCLSPRQRIAIAGAEVEYLFGEDEVLIEARHLVNGRSVLAGRAGGGRFVSLLLDRPELICVNGCWVESMWLGALADCPVGLSLSALGPAAAAGMPVPLHRSTVRRVLLDYEARTLATARAQAGGGNWG